MKNEVTHEELERLGIKVELDRKEVVEFVKHLTITYEGVGYYALLRWDMYSGYEIIKFDDDAPNTLTDLTERPEFEYILDSLTPAEVEL